MSNEKTLSKKITGIHITQYLAEYAVKKFPVDASTGAIKIPTSSDLYHIVWNGMAKPPRGSRHEEKANLLIWLPKRRDGKNPIYYNYIPNSTVRIIESAIRSFFNYDLHHKLMQNERRGAPDTIINIAYEFLREYNLQSISADALLKNWQRYRHGIFPHKPRKYSKTHRFNNN